MPVNNKWDHILEKIYDSANAALAARLHRWRFQNRTIVFTNGCFDILHPGHIHTLATAASFGDRLLVAVNSDSSVRQLKGTGRPVHQENDRMLVLASLGFVDAVVPFTEDTPLNLITFAQPDVLVKGGDYKASDVVGADIVINKGGRVEIVPFLEGHSTTGILERISSEHQP
ncbi:MAG: D-glycero-beta-D-manno-heptose 1-phosphate adenylyltransferase [Flavobacteriales bacterium]|nr:D-glycero-beta-D-manno-heptose 1-phosphate adenylyltransferase [Flavobacteriales bacterium]